jgi:hypothetical protein
MRGFTPPVTIRRGGGTSARFGQCCRMGVRTRGLDIAKNAKRQVADAAARTEAKAVIERWNEKLVASRDMLWSPTIRAALIAGTPWLDVFCPGCGTSRAIDLRKVDRHPLASVATLVLGLRCSWCPESAPTPKILGLHAFPPAAKAAAPTNRLVAPFVSWATGAAHVPAAPLPGCPGS